MNFLSILISGCVILATLPVMPASADPGRGNGHRNGAAAWQQTGHGHARRDDRERFRHVADCPPGLARKNPPCVPPGQARKHQVRYGNRVGEILRIGDYAIVRDPRRYDLDTGPGWDYYRDDRNIYRVDSGTRKILAVLNLIQAFSN